MHEFVARGLAYRFDDERGFDPDAMRSFYGRPDWPAVLRLFADMDEYEADVHARFREAMRELASS
jgi:hypothetical protein